MHLLTMCLPSGECQQMPEGEEQCLPAEVNGLRLRQKANVKVPPSSFDLPAFVFQSATSP